MEVTITIKLSDGNTRVIELTNASIQTNWSNGYPAPGYDPANPIPLQLIGNLALQGTIKDSGILAGSV